MDLLRNFKALVKVALFLFFALLLSSRQYFGDPIDCDVEYDKNIVDVFCWITGTFIIVDNPAEEKGLHGLGNAVGQRTYTLLFYQWMCLLFCLQALLFYIPRYLWKTWEGNRLGCILKDLCGPFIPDAWTPEHKENIKTFLLDDPHHNIFAYRFAFCELLNLFNLISQVYLMNWYLQGRFSLYGFDVATKPWPEAYNTVFPKRAKCTYLKYGPSGSLVSLDALCVLPLNILNEKFFLILWFWMIFLFVLTVGALIYRAITMCWLQFRIFIMMANFHHFGKGKLSIIVKNLSYGQFFLLFNLGKHINPIIYQELLMIFFEHFEEKCDDNSLDL